MEGPEADVHNFSTSPSQHRLPTVNGIEALQTAASRSRGISTSITALDALLINQNTSFNVATPGIQRGHVTEVWGPPGVGKTTIGLQAVVNAMHSTEEDSHVLWINTGSPLMHCRLEEMLQAGGSTLHGTQSSPSADQFNVEAILDEKLTYLDAHTLPRLLTVFLHTPGGLLSANTCLIVVDDLSNLLLGAISRNTKKLKSSAPVAVQEKLEKQAASRRFQILESLGAAMAKMAAIRNLAVLVLTNATTNFKGSKKAILKPALSSQAWDTAIHTRVMLYRDFPSDEQEASAEGNGTLRLRYAEIQRLARKEVVTTPNPFLVLAEGIREVLDPKPGGEYSATLRADILSSPIPHDVQDELPLLPLELSPPSAVTSPTQPRMQRQLEIADSEDEDAEDDIDGVAQPELPPMPTASDRWREEMILETHESALLRQDRHARIRGSEDEVPRPSSDVEAEEDETEDLQSP